jgi:hypothetical protein
MHNSRFTREFVSIHEWFRDVDKLINRGISWFMAYLFLGTEIFLDRYFRSNASAQLPDHEIWPVHFDEFRLLSMWRNFRRIWILTNSLPIISICTIRTESEPFNSRCTSRLCRTTESWLTILD